MLVWYNRFFKFITGLFPPSDLFTRNRLLKNCLTSFLFLDSPKWIDLYSFFDCGKPWPGLDPREMGFCNPVQFPNSFPQLVPSISLTNVVNMPANFTFGSVSGKNNPITTECIFPCGINSGRMLQKSFFFWRAFTWRPSSVKAGWCNSAIWSWSFQKTDSTPPLQFFVLKRPGERAAISLCSSIWTTSLTFDWF